MDLGTIIIAVVSVAIFILPIMYVQRQHKNKTKARLKEFIALAEQQQLNLSVHDQWNQNFAIGLDTDRKKLFYLRKQDGQLNTTLIDLTEVEKCRVVNVHQDLNSTRLIDLIELRFTYRNQKPAERSLVFYTKEESMSLSGELQLAEKWNSLVNSVLQTKPAKSTPAEPQRKTVV